MEKEWRIATIAATGKKYVVQQIQYGKPDKVFVWGELAGFKVDRKTQLVINAKFEKGRTFLLSAVTLETLPRDAATANLLWQQKIGALTAAGHLVTVSPSGNIRDHGTPEQREQRAALRAAESALVRELLDASPSLRALLKGEV